MTVSTQPNTNAASASLSASPANVVSGGYSTLSWSSSGVDSCTASGGWSGAVTLSGTTSVGPLKQDTTYNLNCTGSNGNAVAMTAVTIQQAVIHWTPPTTNTDGSALTNLAGYRIHYGSASKSYGQSVTISDASVTQWTLPLAAGDWYFVVAALNSDGKEGVYSGEVTKTIK